MRITNSQESDARKLPISPRYVVESYSKEEEPTENLKPSPHGIHNVSIKEELTEDEPMEGESREDEPMEYASEEPSENRINGLVYRNGDEKKLASCVVSNDVEPVEEKITQVNEDSHTNDSRGTKRKRECVAMINEAFEAKVEILKEYGDESLELTCIKTSTNQ